MNRRRFLCGGAVLFAVGFTGGWFWHEDTTAPKEAQAAAFAAQPSPATIPNDGKLRIIAFGAHPDDCELKVGGTAAKWAAMGHHVKLVSVTNGDIGHWKSAGGPLAQRRTAEAAQADKLLGVESLVLDIHDGELLPTLENRRLITRVIREWKADLVFSHRPNDYHPDHRYTGVLVQDAAFMVTVPFFCPDVPYLEKNPIFMYYGDRFERPNPTRADMVVSIDDTMEKKLAAIEALESQFYEGGANGSAKLIPKDATGVEPRKQQVRRGFQNRDGGVANKYRDKLKDIYGAEAGAKVQYAEVFEICEYGSQPSATELKKLFPFVPQ